VQVTEAVLAAARRGAGESATGYVTLPQILSDRDVARFITMPLRVVGVMNELEAGGYVRMVTRGTADGSQPYKWALTAGVITGEES